MDVFNVMQSSGHLFESSRGTGGAAACVLVPLMLVFVLGGILLAVAGVTFGIQALIVGTQLTLNGPTACEQINTLYIWLIVFGSFEVGSFALGCCKSTTTSDSAKNKQDDHQTTGGCGCITSLFSLFLFAWLCYGMYLVYVPPASLPTCVANEWNIFTLAVQFNFYATIAFHLLLAFWMCCMGCCAGSAAMNEVRQAGTPATGNGGWTVSLV